MVALATIREKEIAPLIAQRGKLKTGPCGNMSNLEQCYKNLQGEMKLLFRELRSTLSHAGKLHMRKQVCSRQA